MPLHVGLEGQHLRADRVGIDLTGTAGERLGVGPIALGERLLGPLHQVAIGTLLGLVGLEDPELLGLDLGLGVLVEHLGVEADLVLLGQLDGDLEAAGHGPGRRPGACRRP